MSNSLRPHGLYSPWNSPGRYTGVSSLSLLQGIFPTQALNPGLPHCRRILYQLSYQGSAMCLRSPHSDPPYLPNCIEQPQLVLLKYQSKKPHTPPLSCLCSLLRSQVSVLTHPLFHIFSYPCVFGSSPYVAHPSSNQQAHLQHSHHIPGSLAWWTQLTHLVSTSANAHFI